jgi:hypothetical protein
MAGFPYTFPFVFGSAGIITIQSRYPQITAQSLFSFVNFQYETQSNSYYTKQFQVSTDGGVTYGAYQTLNEANVRAMNATIDDDLSVKVRKVELTTPDVTGDLILKGNYSKLINPFFENTFLSDFFDFNDQQVVEWGINVLEKLYEHGIIAFYLNRNAGNSLFEDEDFISLFYTITHFCAFLVIYARIFEDIESNELLLKNFFDNVGIYFSIDADLTELQGIYADYISEFEKRGTLEIVRRVADGASINGELLRLMNYTETDEFLFALTQPQDVGWNIGNSSPMYFGTNKVINLNKAYEHTEEVLDLTKYPLVEDTYISINGDYMQITGVPAATTSGIADNGVSKRIVIDPNLDYEISFYVKRTGAALNNFSFGVQCFDVDGNSINMINHRNGGISNYFFYFLNVTAISNIDYWVRGIIYNTSEANNAASVINLGYNATHNLRFPSTANYIVPVITYSNAATTVLIKDIKMRPLTFPYSQGMLGAKNLVLNYVKNNSGTSEDTITRIVKDELVPYNCIYSPYYLNLL